jgi:hypothetical protein
MNKSEQPVASNKQELKSDEIKTIDFETASDEVQKILQEDRMAWVNLGLTDKEKQSLQNLEIEKETENFHYWGNVYDGNLLSEIEAFLKNVGENSEDTLKEISDLVVRLSRGIARGFNTDHVWIESRSILPNNFFDTPLIATTIL